MKPSSAAAVARRIADELGTSGIDYAVGGALALGVWGVPRATVDVDLDAFVELAELSEVFAALRRAGCTVDEEAAAQSARDRGDFRAFFDGMRIDVFVPSIPFYDSVRARTREAPLEGRPARFLSPEDLSVFKLLFFRTKDILDLERLVAIRSTDFDRSYVRSRLVEIVREDDPRVSRWDALVASVDSRG